MSKSGGAQVPLPPPSQVLCHCCSNRQAQYHKRKLNSIGERSGALAVEADRKLSIAAHVRIW